MGVANKYSRKLLSSLVSKLFKLRIYIKSLSCEKIVIKTMQCSQTVVATVDFFASPQQ